jgi:hypothetical protein
MYWFGLRGGWDDRELEDFDEDTPEGKLALEDDVNGEYEEDAAQCPGDMVDYVRERLWSWGKTTMLRFTQSYLVPPQSWTKPFMTAAFHLTL